MMPDECNPLAPGQTTGTAEDELEQEFYTALRAAGASPEDARSCLQTGGTPAEG